MELSEREKNPSAVLKKKSKRRKQQMKPYRKRCMSCNTWIWPTEGRKTPCLNPTYIYIMKKTTTWELLVHTLLNHFRTILEHIYHQRKLPKLSNQNTIYYLFLKLVGGKWVIIMCNHHGIVDSYWCRKPGRQQLCYLIIPQEQESRQTARQHCVIFNLILMLINKPTSRSRSCMVVTNNWDKL